MKCVAWSPNGMILTIIQGHSCNKCKKENMCYFLSLWMTHESMYLVVFIPPAVLGGNNFNIGQYTQTFQPVCIHTCQTYTSYRHHWLLPFYTSFTDHDLAWGSQGQHKAKPLGFILCSNSVKKWLEVAQALAGVDYIRKMTAKKPGKYCEYGSYEYLLHLFFS